MISLRRLYAPYRGTNAMEVIFWRLAMAIGYGESFFEIRLHYAVLHIGVGKVHIALCLLP